MTSDGESTLDDLPVGGEGIVGDVRCDRAVACRLMEMGLLPGTVVRVVRVAPLGDPIELELRGYALSIRRNEARGIVMRDVREAVGSAAAERLSDPAVALDAPSMDDSVIGSGAAGPAR